MSGQNGTGHGGPMPVPPRTKFRGYREESRVNYGRDAPATGPSGFTDAQLQLGAALRLADAAELIARRLTLIDCALGHIADVLDRLAPKEPDPAAAREKQEAASRARAEAVYAAAIRGKSLPAGAAAVLGRPVDDLHLSVRAGNVLRRAAIETVGDLASHSADDLLGMRNFGMTSLVEVREKLAAIGLSLKGEG